MSSALADEIGSLKVTTSTSGLTARKSGRAVSAVSSVLISDFSFAGQGVPDIAQDVSADFLVSVDRDLLEASGIGARTVDPAVFLAALATH